MNATNVASKFREIGSKTRHLGICAVALSFKLLGPLMFFCSLCTTDHLFFYLWMTAIVLSIDFYFMKNIAGRFMAGFRWGGVVSQGKSVWTFDSAPIDVQPSDLESKLFWALLMVHAAVWPVMACLGFLVLSGVCGAFGVVLGWVNFVNFIKCSEYATVMTVKMLNGFVGRAMATSVASTLGIRGH